MESMVESKLERNRMNKLIKSHKTISSRHKCSFPSLTKSRFLLECIFMYLGDVNQDSTAGYAMIWCRFDTRRDDTKNERQNGGKKQDLWLPQHQFDGLWLCPNAFNIIIWWACVTRVPRSMPRCMDGSYWARILMAYDNISSCFHNFVMVMSSKQKFPFTG